MGRNLRKRKISGIICGPAMLNKEMRMVHLKGEFVQPEIMDELPHHSPSR
jgi:hypothetical protein